MASLLHARKTKLAHKLQISGKSLILPTKKSCQFVFVDFCHTPESLLSLHVIGIFRRPYKVSVLRVCMYVLRSDYPLGK